MKFDVSEWLSQEWVQSYEERIAKQMYSVKAWLEYVDAIIDADDSTTTARDWVLRRAVQHLPKSYKLWKNLWEFQISHNDNGTDTVFACLERALVTLSSYPRVWIAYIEYSFEHSISCTHLRRTCNRALESVAVSQHDKLWNVIVPHILDSNCILPWESINALLQRYCMFQPDYKIEYAQLCERNGKWGPAAAAYLQLDDAAFQVNWESFCELVSQHSLQVERAGIPWQNLLETAILQNKDSAAILYSYLASAWIRRGSLDMARAVYEQGLRNVTSIRDFSILYAAYLQLEEGVMTQLSESILDDDENEEQGEPTTNDDWDLLVVSQHDSSTNKLAEMELALARTEHLTKRRPLLLNAVKLRQNPNDVQVWLERADLLEPRQATTALEQALKSIQPTRNARTSAIVVKLVELYDTQQARDLLDRVCRQRFGNLHYDELAVCWARWIELELQHEQYEEALSLARQSVARNKSQHLWDLLFDLEESLGTVQTTKDAYNRAIETKIITVQQVLNFASFLKDKKYFEESFSAYERGIELFAFPSHEGAKLLWKAYLESFLTRYQSTKVERTRHLFHRCLSECPAEDCVEFFLMNGAFEEEYGLTKRALNVYKAMCDKAVASEKYTAYQLYIAKTTRYLGVAATRDIYQEAINVLKDNPESAVQICQDFAKTEVGLQQMDRARAIYAYGAQSADPRRMPEFWKDWNDFEISHGNEDTFREMLRVKRSVEAAFSTIDYNIMSSENVDTMSDAEAMRMIAQGEGVDLDETALPKKTNVSGFVPSKRTATAASLDDVEERVAKLRKATGTATTEAADDDDEIDLDDIDAEIEEAAAEGAMAAVQDVSTKAVPDAVFGGLKNETKD